MTNDFKIKNGLQLGGALTENVGTISGNADLDLSTGNVFSYTPTADATFAFSNAGETEHSFVLGVTGAEVSTSYDLANAAYDGVSFSVAGQETSPKGLRFNTDGTKMFVVGAGSDTIYEYSLTSGFDLSTASYSSVSFSVASQDTFPTDLVFNNSGSKMYVSGGGSSSVYQYTLSTPFSLSTASYDNISFSLTSEIATPSSVNFSQDGTKMYALGLGAPFFFTPQINQYSLSTAFDISTAASDSVAIAVGARDQSATGVAFSNDGTKMFLVGQDNDTVFEYQLSQAFNLATASYVGVGFSIAAQESFPTQITFSDNGGKMYVIGEGTDAIYQYTTGTAPAPATFTYPASVAWPSGTAPDAPAVGETDILEFSTIDGGTTWYGVRSGDALA